MRPQPCELGMALITCRSRLTLFVLFLCPCCVVFTQHFVVVDKFVDQQNESFYDEYMQSTSEYDCIPANFV